MARSTAPKKKTGRNAASSSTTRIAGQAATAAAAASANSPTGSDNTMTSNSGKRRDNNFLEKLWNFLEDDISKAVMAFSVNGKFLVILDPETVPTLLAAANICKHKDYGSFQRQMCIYGWKRISQSDISKVVLIDGEEPGASVAQLGGHIKIMQHEVLERDSPMDEVKAVPRKAKPKASRAKDGGIAAAAKAAAAAANAADGLAYDTPMDSTASASDSGSNVRSSRKSPLRPTSASGVTATATTLGTSAKPSKRSSRGSTSLSRASKKRAAPSVAVKAEEEEQDFLADPLGMSSMDEDGRLSDMEFEALVADDDIKVKEEIEKSASKHRRKGSSETLPQTRDFSFASNFSTTSNPFPAQHTMPSAPVSAPIQSTSQLNYPIPSGSIPVPIPGAPQLNQNGDGTGYASLPKSLQEAFLILENFKPPANEEISLTSDQMIDPALTGGAFDSSILPPLPPKASQASSTLSNILNQAKTSNGSSACTDTSLSHLVNVPTSAEDLTTAHLNDTMDDVTIDIPPPLYYQAPPGTHFSQREQNQQPVQPHRPYFASAFSGLADMHTSPGW